MRLVGEYGQADECDSRGINAAGDDGQRQEKAQIGKCPFHNNSTGWVLIVQTRCRAVTAMSMSLIPMKGAIRPPTP